MLDAKIVGRVIRRYREKIGKSQEVVSGLADIERSHLSAIERGERRPSLDTFYKIGLALDIGPSYLMKAIQSEIEEQEEKQQEQDKKQH